MGRERAESWVGLGVRLVTSGAVTVLCVGTTGCVGPDLLLGRGEPAGLGGEGATPSTQFEPYAPEFVWERSAVFGSGATTMGEIPGDLDAFGATVFEYGEVASLLGTGWSSEPSPFVWDSSWYGRDFGLWVHGDDEVPVSGADDFLHDPRQPNAVPVVRFRNPLTTAARMRIEVLLDVAWVNQLVDENGPVIDFPPGSQPATLLLGHVGASGPVELRRTRVDPQAGGTQLDLFSGELVLSPGDVLVLSAETSGDFGWIVIEDDMTIELLGEP